MYKTDQRHPADQFFFVPTQRKVTKARVVMWIGDGLVKNSFISLAEADWAGSCVKIIRCLISPSGGRVRVIRPARFREYEFFTQP
jgi:hypothetical protein